MFVLSLADFMLACLWIVGGYFWLRRVDNKAWCLVVSLMTIVSLLLYLGSLSTWSIPQVANMITYHHYAKYIISMLSFSLV